MKKALGRRAFLNLWQSRDESPLRGDSGWTPSQPQENRAPETPRPSPVASGFSLADFYANRPSTAMLPPIRIRESALAHAGRPVKVGLAPAHEAPDLSDGEQAEYAELAADWERRSRA